MSSTMRARLTAFAHGDASDHAVRAGLLVVRIGPVFMLLVVSAAFAAETPLFLTGRNLTNLGFQSSWIIALSLGQLLVILTRGIDISVGSMIGLVDAAGALAFAHHWPAPLTIVLMLAVGIAGGWLNGLLFVKGRLPHSFIATLATFGLFAGIAFLLTGGNILASVPHALVIIGSGQVGPIPYATIIILVLVVLTWLLTKHLKWGRWIYAIGGNPEGANRVGIPAGRLLISVYVFSGFMAAVAGLLIAGQTGVGDANAGVRDELTAIAAVMVGGTSFLGGRGGVSNAVVGALTISVINNGLQLLNVNGYWTQVATGLIIIAAVELNVLRGHFESHFRLMQASAIEREGE